MNKKEKLFELLKQESDLKQFLNIAYPILENPIVVMDTSYNLLMCTENVVIDDPLWNELILYGTFTHDTVDFFNEKFIDEAANTDISVILKGDTLKYDRMFGKVFDKYDLQIGNVCVVGCYNRIEKKDIKNLEIICEYLAEIIQDSDCYQKTDRVLQKTFINKLIEGNIHDRPFIENSVNMLYKDLRDNLYIAVVDILEYEHTLTHLAYFRSLLEQLQDEFKYFIYFNNIVIIISTDNPTINVKRDLNILNEFFIKYKIYAGVSKVFHNLFELHKYYKQALNALNYGINVNIDQHIFLHDNYAVEYLLSSIDDTISIPNLCNPIVLLMQEYDDKHSTFYSNILYSYLISGMNSQTAAQKVKLSHKTFCNKLEELWKIFEIDYSNGNILFSLFFSMKLLKCFPD